MDHENIIFVFRNPIFIMRDQGVSISSAFIVDGKAVVDPLGRNIRYDRFDQELTRLLIPLERMKEEEKPPLLTLPLE